MEPDSTTWENNAMVVLNEICFPFSISPGNLKFYAHLMNENGERCSHKQIIDKLKEIGLIPKTIRCSMAKPDCKVICKTARVIDRIQWVCEACGSRQSIRIGSFFLRLQCSIAQVLQMILAWCEDADYAVAAEHFGVKSKVAISIYDKLDELAVKQYSKIKLGGENCVVLAELYPDCLNRLSPDTTDQPHVHRILMLADTKHIPTRYWLQVLRDDIKKNSSLNNQHLKADIEKALSTVILPNSTVVTGSSVPAIDGVSSVQQLLQHCDIDMQHFLTSRIWRQAVMLCTASREMCAGAGGALCAGAIQRYLTSALYRIRHGDDFYKHVLDIIANELTVKCDNDSF